MVKEVRRSLNFYQSQFPEGSSDATVDRLIVCGGTGKLKGLEVYLHSILDMPVEIADVFHNRFVNLDDDRATLLAADSASMVLAVGLALRELVARRVEANAPKKPKVPKAPKAPKTPKSKAKAGKS
jgi:Tfp pilus assembly PilM family ATPase